MSKLRKDSEWIKRYGYLFITGFLISSACFLNILIAQQYDFQTRISSAVPQTKTFLIEGTGREQVQNGDKIKYETANTPPVVPTHSTTQIPILMYHYIGDYYNPSATGPDNALMGNLAVPKAKFEEQMSYLHSKGYSTIDLSDLTLYKQGKFKLPKKPIVLTFDDGYQDFYTNAFPILKKFGLKAEVYVVANFIGKNGYLTAAMIHELSQSNLVKIGSHGMTHADLTSIPLESALHEIDQSKVILEQKFSIKVTDFCYPFGKYNSTLESEAQKVYATATTTEFGHWNNETVSNAIPRIRIVGFYNEHQFSGLI